ncbi:MAG: hypothetical protein R3E08_14405 [Thiotrichaceae bacterium]
MTLSIDPKNEYRLLGMILITLHLTLWWDFAGLLSHLFLLSHFAVFLLWQPPWGKREQLTQQNILTLLDFSVFLHCFKVYGSSLCGNWC